MSYLTEADATAAGHKRDVLAQLMGELLAAHDHYALNGALTQAPSQDAYKVLWQILREQVEAPPAGAAHWQIPFALPIVLVAGARGQHTLPGRIDGDALLALLRQHGVIAADADCRLSGALVHPGDLAAVNPATLADWREPGQADAMGSAVREAPVSFKDEGVFLRYLVGSVTQHRDAPPAIRLGGQVGAWGMPLAQAIGDALQVDGLTLFAIPRVPQTWLAAQDSARVTQLETRLQVAASNALRSIRGKGRTPVATIAAHEGGEVRITFSSQEEADRWEGFVWPLAPLDTAEQVRDFAEGLFRECQVDDIRVIDTVQPDKEGELPFFVTAHFPPRQQH
ncbi:hypothetical protein [Chitiniphilus eburneus]|uniref:Uncharacterized protein n=1 Tax=Chitiniphilus eburneus TaxID=2571148 RepID=A0A4U0PE93_9NEIS|nr:hypothetical protein [Chitiniphilus eburneus]TJZ66133.1 hypothetical protein FAZ21_17590 [Chitiniphilus eburneus]